MACQACHQRLADAERSPDIQTDALRRCPTCGERSARLVTVTEHVREVTVALVPIGEAAQGASFDYACDQCGHGFTLLSPKRRLWLWYGVVVGVLMCALLLLDDAVAAFAGVMGVAVALTMGAWLAWDGKLRRKSDL